MLNNSSLITVGNTYPYWAGGSLDYEITHDQYSMIELEELLNVGATTKKFTHFKHESLHHILPKSVSMSLLPSHSIDLVDFRIMFVKNMDLPFRLPSQRYEEIRS